MSRRKKANPKGAATPARVRRPSARGVALIVSATAIGLVGGFGLWKASHPAPQPPASVPQVDSTNQPAEVSQHTPEFQKLAGKWVRPDGGYVVEVRHVDASGRMDASYLNPSPIHVAKAEASQDGAATKVFLELRDVNYPGSTYDLTYDPQSDQLNGIYYQAVQRQRFEVTFVRMQ